MNEAYIETKKTEERTRVNQLSAVLYGNLDDLVAGEISSDRGVLASLANDVGFIGLWENKSVQSTDHARGTSKERLSYSDGAWRVGPHNFGGGNKKSASLSQDGIEIVSSGFPIIHLKTAIVCNDSSWACEEG